MNIKRTFGFILTLLGIVGLVYAAIVFVNTSGGTQNVKSVIVYGILGLLFFIYGISLVKATKDET